MYKFKKQEYKSSLQSVEKLEGEPIEHKVERILNNGEPITDGAPEIFTDRKDGVLSAYNIRTDRWEIATDAMDKVQGSIQAKRDAKAEQKKAKKEGKIVELNADKESGGQSVVGTEAK